MSAQHRAQEQQERRNELLANPHTRSQTSRLLADPAQKAMFNYVDAVKGYEELKRLQGRALDAEHQGLLTHEKTQHVVHALQDMINNKIWPRLKRLDQEADRQLRMQTRQNQGGNP